MSQKLCNKTQNIKIKWNWEFSESHWKSSVIKIQLSKVDFEPMRYRNFDAFGFGGDDGKN